MKDFVVCVISLWSCTRRYRSGPIKCHSVIMIMLYIHSIYNVSCIYFNTVNSEKCACNNLQRCSRNPNVQYYNAENPRWGVELSPGTRGCEPSWQIWVKVSNTRCRRAGGWFVPISKYASFIEGRGVDYIELLWKIKNTSIEQKRILLMNERKEDDMRNIYYLPYLQHLSSHTATGSLYIQKTQIAYIEYEELMKYNIIL